MMTHAILALSSLSLSLHDRYGNMLTDHMAVNYFDALAEALDVMSAPCPPPEWVPFKLSAKCQCCRATFSWNATGTSGATTSREKHNCRGMLVSPYFTYYYPIAPPPPLSFLFNVYVPSYYFIIIDAHTGRLWCIGLWSVQ
jgi:hypothetical protein